METTTKQTNDTPITILEYYKLLREAKKLNKIKNEDERKRSKAKYFNYEDFGGTSIISIERKEGDVFQTKNEPGGEK
jgi:hypothetical protein